MREKEHEQNVRAPFTSSVIKPALWEVLLPRQIFYFFFTRTNATRQDIAPKSMGMSDSSPAQPETAILGLPSFFFNYITRDLACQQAKFRADS